MRIIHISDHFQPWMGYQETYLAKEQTRMGHDLLVITANRYGRRPGAILGTREASAGFSEEDGIKVLRLPILFELPTNWAYPWLRNLIGAVQDFSPDIIHCHGVLTFSNIRIALGKKKMGYVLVVDNHTFEIYSCSGYLDMLIHPAVFALSTAIAE